MRINNWDFMMLLGLMFFILTPSYARKKNKYVDKRTNSVELLQIEPDPILNKSYPDIEGEKLRLPLFFALGTMSNHVHGFDFSHHQGDINWDDLATDPKSGYVYLKATEGANFVDSKYKYNFAEAKRVGLRVGSYHFFRPNVNGEVQYRNFINNIDYTRQDLLPIIDVEIHPSRNMSLAIFYKRLDILLELVTKKMGSRPIIYTGKNFYNKYFANGRYHKYKFMIAAYTFDEPVLNNNDDYVIWQYTATGEAMGVKGDVDISRLRANHKLDEILYK